MINLLPEQVEALRQLKRAYQYAGVDAVIIGATAYRVWIDDDRRTQDVDVALAVDIDQLGSLTDRLQAAGWVQDTRREERWLTKTGARIDLLPIGDQARSQGYLTWPKAEMRMSVVGFVHVFAEAVEKELATGMTMRVVPLHVLALLKIVAYMDDQHGRSKDLEDLGRLMEQYELEGDRRFSDEVFEASCDFESAGAFLLGLDVGRLSKGSEAEILNNLIALLQEDNQMVQRLLWPRHIVELAAERQKRTEAFAAGFRIGQQESHSSQNQH
jgi:predicted nucleotidyltransferase